MINGYRFSAVKFLLAILLMGVGNYEVKAQAKYQRVYANSQTSVGTALLTSISQANDAVDGNLWTFSTIDVAAVAGVISRYQEFTFNTPISQTSTANIKFTTELPVNLVGNAAIKIQAYNGAAAVGPEILMSSGILGLAGGTNMLDYVVPAPGTSGTYNKIRITLEAGGVVITARMKIYEVYSNIVPAGNIACDGIADYLYGVAGGAVLSATNGVTDHTLAVDGNTLTFATLRANVALAVSVFETAIFSSQAKQGDSIKIIFRSGAGGLLDASLLSSNFKVAAINGNNIVTTLADQSPLLKLSLLSGSTTVQTLSFPVTGPFDRIRVSIGDGLLNALSTLELYEIKRVAPKPTITATGLTNGQANRCIGETISLTVSNPETNGTYKWFTVATGGTAITTGVSADSKTFSPTGLAVGTHTYYVALVRQGCTDEASDRAKVTINILALPTITLGSGPSVCKGINIASLNYTTTSGSPTTYSIVWASPLFTAITNTSLPASPISISIPPAATAGTYSGTLTVKNANGCTSTDVAFSLVLHPKPPTPHVAVQ